VRDSSRTGPPQGVPVQDGQNGWRLYPEPPEGSLAEAELGGGATQAAVAGP
jgi:hypothetical protein